MQKSPINISSSVMINKNFVHKKETENIFIQNLRRTIPYFIEQKAYEEILNDISNKEKEILNHYYKKINNKGIYSIKYIPLEISMKQIKETKKLSENEIENLLSFYDIKNINGKQLLTIKNNINITEKDEKTILYLLGETNNILTDTEKAIISDILEKTDSIEKEDKFAANMITNPQHPYFFEHKNEHIPGMMIIEACRQFFQAIGHKYGKIPLTGINNILLNLNAN